MTAIGAVLGWLAVCGLLWLSALCLIAAVLRTDGGFALFAVLIGVLALILARGIAAEYHNV